MKHKRKILLAFGILFICIYALTPKNIESNGVIFSVGPDVYSTITHKGYKGSEILTYISPSTNIHFTNNELIVNKKSYGEIHKGSHISVSPFGKVLIEKSN
jgi:hypothetical protein